MSNVGELDVSPTMVERRARDGHWEQDSLSRRLLEHLPLLWAWTAREYQVRYRQSGLGLAWSVVQPLGLLAIFGFVFARLLHVQSDGLPYLTFAYAGLVSWAFVSSALTGGFASVINSMPIASKVYFPREVMPLGLVLACTLDLAVGTVLLFGAALLQGVRPGITLLALVPVYAVLVLWVAALATFGAAISVFVRDIRLALPLALQLVFIASPIMYPASYLPAKWRWIDQVNPVGFVAESVRDVLLRHRWPSPALLGLQAMAAALLLVLALAYVRSVEPRFADVA